MYSLRRTSLPAVAMLLAITSTGAQAPAPHLRLYGDMLGTNTYLVDTFGARIHTWRSSWGPGLAVYLLDDGTLLRTINTGFVPGAGGGTGGGVQRLALDGSVLWDFRYDGPGRWSHHDIEPLPNGNLLMLAWEDKTPSEAVSAGRNPTTISFNVFRPDHVIEVQPTGASSGNIVWEWHVWDHVVQDFDSTKANYGVVADQPQLVDINYPFGGMSADWTHCNAIDYDAVHDWIVISSRFFNEIWVIDHSTTTLEAAGHSGGNYGAGGDLLYRWGNPAAYRRGAPVAQQLFGQHSANFIPPGYPGAGNILLFNNLRPGGSTAEEIALPLDASGRFILAAGKPFGPAASITVHQLNYNSAIVSSARRARNGNTLICAGQQGRMVEVDPTGAVVWNFNTNMNVFHAHYIEQNLWTDRTAISANGGGKVTFDLLAGSEHAGQPYLVLGSASGTSPGFSVNGHLVPLVPDGYFSITIGAANNAPFGNTFGLLDPLGRSRADLTLPPGLPGLIGLHLDHAFLLADPLTGLVVRASNSVPLDFVQ